MVGDIVHFRLDKDETRPAIIVKEWTPDCVQLQVFIDGTNDLQHGLTSGECSSGVMWRTSIIRGDDIGQWQKIYKEDKVLT